MEVEAAPTHVATPVPALKHGSVEEDINRTRDKLRRLREDMVKRTVQRLGSDGWAPDLRALPDHYPPLIEGKHQMEMQILRIIVTFLLDPKTQLPMEADSMHRRIMQGPMGPDYERCLIGLGANQGPQPVLARLCRDGLLEALHFQLGPRAGGGPRRMFVSGIERQSLARVAGVEDTMSLAMIQQQQAAAAALQPPGPGMMTLPPAVPLPPPAGMLMPGLLPTAPGVPGGLMGQPGPPGMQAMQQGLPQGQQQLPGIMPMGMPSITGGPEQGFLGMGLGMPGQQQQQQQPSQQQQQPGMSDAQSQEASSGNKRTPELDLDALLSRKTNRDKMMMDRGGAAELQAVLAKPTAREAAQLEAFRTAAGQCAIQEHCPHLTKDECKKANNSPVACHRLHFKRLIYPHTDISLGNCSYLNTCRNFRNCKYIHYEIDDDETHLHPAMATPGLPPHLLPSALQGPGAAAVAAQAKGQPPVPKYLQALPQPQWIRCDIRTIDMKVLGKFGVIMADPPWQIHQDLPYGTMEDNEMRRMDIGCLQDDGVIFLWVTGRAMELGRECLKIWGYDRVDELIWVKTNQLNRLIRTGRTGHWLNHSKEHCLVGVKGKPVLNRYVDCDVVVAEVRETSRKPDEMYALLERLSPGTRKLEIFARSHNLTNGWVGLGNQLDSVNILDPDMRARYVARYGPEGPDGKLPLPV